MGKRKGRKRKNARPHPHGAYAAGRSKPAEHREEAQIQSEPNNSNRESNQQQADDGVEGTVSERLIAGYTRSLANWTKGLVAVGVVTIGILIVHAFIFYETDQTARISNRAYVYFKQIEWKSEVTGTAPRFVGYPKWENTGNTGTINLRYYVACGPTESSLDFRQSGTLKRVLGPKQTGDGGACILDQFLFPKGLPEPGQFATVWVGGKASYYDAFHPGHLRITEFCMQVPISVEKVTSRDGPNSIGIVSVGVGHNIICPGHNCSDNDCPAEDRQ